MADYPSDADERFVQQLAQLLSGGQSLNELERGTPHPGDTTSRYQMSDAERTGEIKPAREKRSFTDQALGSKFSDQQMPWVGMGASNLGAPPEAAQGLQDVWNIVENVMEAHGAVGSRSAPLSGQIAASARGKSQRPGRMGYGSTRRQPRESQAKNPLDFELQAKLETLRGTPEGDRLAEAIEKGLLFGETEGERISEPGRTVRTDEDSMPGLDKGPFLVPDEVIPPPDSQGTGIASPELIEAMKQADAAVPIGIDAGMLELFKKIKEVGPGVFPEGNIEDVDLTMGEGPPKARYHKKSESERPGGSIEVRGPSRTYKKAQTPEGQKLIGGQDPLDYMLGIIPHEFSHTAAPHEFPSRASRGFEDAFHPRFKYPKSLISQNDELDPMFYFLARSGIEGPEKKLASMIPSGTTVDDVQKLLAQPQGNELMRRGTDALSMTQDPHLVEKGLDIRTPESFLRGLVREKGRQDWNATEPGDVQTVKRTGDDNWFRPGDAPAAELDLTGKMDAPELANIERLFGSYADPVHEIGVPESWVEHRVDTQGERAHSGIFPGEHQRQTVEESLLNNPDIAQLIFDLRNRIE